MTYEKALEKLTLAGFVECSAQEYRESPRPCGQLHYICADSGRQIESLYFRLKDPIVRTTTLVFDEFGFLANSGLFRDILGFSKEQVANKTLKIVATLDE